MADDRFSVVDYVVFSIMLLISALIGIWHGCGPGGKQKTTAEYLLGDRQMKNWPVAISILVSFLSAITLLGLPAEIYTYGTQFYMVVISYIFICATVATVFIPMFRRIKITSVNEVRTSICYFLKIGLAGCGIWLIFVAIFGMRAKNRSGQRDFNFYVTA